MNDQEREWWVSLEPKDFIGCIATEFIQDGVGIQSYIDFALHILRDSDFEITDPVKKYKLIETILEKLNESGNLIKDRARFMKEYSRMDRDTE